MNNKHTLTHTPEVMLEEIINTNAAYSSCNTGFLHVPSNAILFTFEQNKKSYNSINIRFFNVPSTANWF